MFQPRFAPRALSAAVMSACALMAQADEVTTLKPVVVTGTYVAHDAFDLPAAVDVVDQATLGQGYARVNVSEAMGAVPGVVVLNRQNYAQDLQISTRGFGARSAFGVRGVKLITDGIPASMPDGQGQAATFNLDAAERIEVLRGPFSALYGNHAGGVVQLFTQDGQGRPSAETSLSAGSYGSWKVDTQFQGEQGGVGYVVDASRFATDGYRDHSQATRDQAMAKLTLNPVDNAKLTLVANALQQRDTQDPMGLDWASYQRAPRSVVQGALDYNTRKSIDHVQGGLNYEQRWGDQQLQLSAYAGSRQVIQYQSIPKATQANPIHSGGVVDFDRSFMGVEGRWISRFAAAGGQLTTTLGLSLERSLDDRRGYENYIGAGAVCGVNLTCGVKGNLRRQEEDQVTSTASYLAAEWQRGNWVVSGGARYSQLQFDIRDQYLSNGDDSGKLTYRQTTPNLNVLYKLTPIWNVYASLARGFEAPTLNELFYSGVGGGFNYALQAATSRHGEVGTKVWLGNETQMNLALFQINTRNEIVVDASSGGRTSYKNASSTLRQGLELSASTRWLPDLGSRFALTAMRATFDQGFTGGSGTVNPGSRLPGVPARSLFADLAWRHQPWGLSTALEWQAQARMYVEDTNSRPAAAGYGALHWRLAFEQKQGPWQFKEYLRVNNLTDKAYAGSVIVGDSNSRYYESAPGRNWLVGVTARYRF